MKAFIISIRELKQFHLMKLLMGAFLFLILVVPASLSWGKEWPSEPITIVVGWGAGGSTDLVTRMLAESMTKSLGVPVLVENKPGAGGELALTYVSKAKPDGYTLASLSVNAFTERPHVRKGKSPYDPVRGFSYICAIFDYGHGFVVRSDSPWKTFPEFLKDAVKEPGKYTLALTSLGGTNHVAWSKLQLEVPGLNVSLVPFKGGAAATTALLGGHVNASFQTKEWKPYVDAGQLRLLAASTPNRMVDYPNIPTWKDLGYKAYTYSPGGYVGPVGIPENIRARLEQEFMKAMEHSGFKDVIQKFGLTKYYKPGKDLYTEVMKLYEENKNIIPKLGIME